MALAVAVASPSSSASSVVVARRRELGARIPPRVPPTSTPRRRHGHASTAAPSRRLGAAAIQWHRGHVDERSRHLVDVILVVTAAFQRAAHCVRHTAAHPHGGSLPPVRSEPPQWPAAGPRRARALPASRLPRHRRLRQRRVGGGALNGARAACRDLSGDGPVVAADQTPCSKSDAPPKRSRRARARRRRARVQTHALAAAAQAAALTVLSTLVPRQLKLQRQQARLHAACRRRASCGTRVRARTRRASREDVDAVRRLLARAELPHAQCWSIAPRRRARSPRRAHSSFVPESVLRESPRLRSAPCLPSQIKACSTRSSASTPCARATRRRQGRQLSGLAAPRRAARVRTSELWGILPESYPTRARALPPSLPLGRATRKTSSSTRATSRCRARRVAPRRRSPRTTLSRAPPRAAARSRRAAATRPRPRGIGRSYRAVVLMLKWGLPPTAVHGRPPADARAEPAAARGPRPPPRRRGASVSGAGAARARARARFRALDTPPLIPS